MMWGAAASVGATGKKMTSLAAGVSESRVKLKGMLGRTSWCQYYRSAPKRGRAKRRWGWVGRGA